MNSIGNSEILAMILSMQKKKQNKIQRALAELVTTNASNSLYDEYIQTSKRYSYMSLAELKFGPL